MLASRVGAQDEVLDVDEDLIVEAALRPAQDVDLVPDGAVHHSAGGGQGVEQRPVAGVGERAEAGERRPAR